MFWFSPASDAEALQERIIDAPCRPLALEHVRLGLRIGDAAQNVDLGLVQARGIAQPLRVWGKEAA